MKLVIVESPTKAKTISAFLGKNYKIESSYGHIRDLPRSRLGINVDNGFEPQYVVPRKIQPRVTALKKDVKEAEAVILATDEDREGEAIAWHLSKALSLENSESKEVKRIVFHEITKPAIAEALKNPRHIDINLVDAQQARRILDRLVGYKLSPFLWQKVARGLSAGRVQSVALRLIAEREEEIKKFKPEKYWTITGEFKKEGGEVIEAALQKIKGEALPKPGLPVKKDVEWIVADLKTATAGAAAVNKKEVGKNPSPPFTTSTLQQTAAGRLGFSAKKTMFLAQGLYEKGYITYMRTDSVNLSGESLAAAKTWIEKNLGKNYATAVPRKFKNGARLAQEAHEAIRPTDVTKEPHHSKIDKGADRLYELIWQRFLASQLPAAVFDATRIEVAARGRSRDYTFVASGNVLKFDGFLKVWPAKFEEKTLPPTVAGEKLTIKKISDEEHQTEPPPRYSEATLVKTLEANGIGRPSTYAPIISVIQGRNYVVKEQGRFHPTEVGALVSKVLVENFPEIFDIQFTAMMEEDLDEVAEGKKEWRGVIKEFYDPFSKLLAEKYEAVKKADFEEKTDIKCEKCGRPMVIKFGRFGKFLACSGYPECKNTKPLKEPPKLIGLKCPQCGEGDVIERRVRNGRARGKIFWGCSRYPACDYASWTNPLSPPEEKPKPKKKDD